MASSSGHDAEDAKARARFESGVTSAATPWTHLAFQNDPEQFQFAIVTDRTGSPRKGVFEDAVKKLNWMRPEFVMSVGDLIKGTSPNGDTNAAEWDEFMSWVEPLDMPFFFLAGNHDIQAKWVDGRVHYEEMRREWEERFGTTYYYFVYKDTLFIALFSNDGKEQSISDEQVSYFEEVLQEHSDVRWTMVFLHHPLWDYPHDSNFGAVEELLEGRQYTVFAGHQHFYRHFERKNSNYYVLATTGGGSPLRGTEFGEFDHITWVTMTDEGPVLTNIRLDGMLPHDVTGSDVGLYSSLLTLNADIETNVLLEGRDSVERGSVFLTFRNRSPYSIEYKGDFFHNHYVHADSGKIELTLSPRESRTIELGFQSMAPFRAEDGVALKFNGSIGFVGEEVPNLSMSGSVPIRLRAGVVEISESESVAFSGSTEWAPDLEPETGEIRYTLDGSEPTRESLKFEWPLAIDRDLELKAKLYSKNGIASEVDTIVFDEVGSGAGLLCEYYEYGDNRALGYVLPDFSQMTPTTVRVVSEIDAETAARRDERFGLVYRGFIDLPESGRYEFHVESDDAARLIIDGKWVVDDPLKHPLHELSGSVDLEKGRVPFELQYFQSRQRMQVGVDYTLPSGKRMDVPSSSFSYGPGAN